MGYRPWDHKESDMNKQRANRSSKEDRGNRGGRRAQETNLLGRGLSGTQAKPELQRKVDGFNHINIL